MGFGMGGGSEWIPASAVNSYLFCENLCFFKPVSHFPYLLIWDTNNIYIL